MQKRLFIISNRLPVTIESKDKAATVNLSSGGLVSAMSSYLEKKESQEVEFEKTFWVGIPGCSRSIWNKAVAKIPADGYEYLPVFVPKKSYDDYYNGMSNSVLWALFHYFPSYAEYKNNYYEQYQNVNREFLQVILSELQSGDVVWIHDYHLLPLAGLIRREMPRVTIGFFLHIPFPSYEIFRIMPKKWQRELLTGMLGADLIGFHTMDYANHFLQSVQMTLGLTNEIFSVRWEDRLVKAGVFPISIDFNKFHQAYDLPQVETERNHMKKQFAGKQIIFSADRLDYTKGVHTRLRAYADFLKKYPEFHGKVVFIMVIVPSRDAISKYAERKKIIDEYIGSLNSRLGNFRWQPVIYQYNSLSFDELIAMYTSCDLALITPIRDGMNLVAKEFVASRKDHKGVLILSEMTGAIKELTGALSINPTDIEEIAEQIKTGLEMGDEEQSKRMMIMQERIKKYDVTDWAEDFLSQIEYVQQMSDKLNINPINHDTRHSLLCQYAKAKNRLLLLDYDGTLVPFVSQPEKAAPDRQLLHLLENLSSDPLNTVFIISGRDRRSLDNWLGHLELNLVAEHGAWIKYAGQDWETVAAVKIEWMEPARLIFNHYTRNSSGSFVEDKTYSMAWHYRKVDEVLAATQSAELLNELHEFAENWGIDVINGNKVIEIRNKGNNKGVAVGNIMRNREFDFIFAAGDDTTDEDMFSQLSGTAHAFTLKVGMQSSYARYNIEDAAKFASLLADLGGNSPSLSLVKLSQPR